MKKLFWSFALPALLAAWCCPKAIYAAEAARPTVSIHTADRVASESGPTTGALVLFRTGSTAETLDVYYTTGGSATSPGDYSPLAGSVRFAVGADRATLVITPVDDQTQEPTESVQVALALPPGASPEAAPYQIGHPAKATVDIRDNEPRNARPVVQLTSPASGQSFTAPAQLSIVVKAADSDGTIQKIEFYANGRSIGTVQGSTPAPADDLYHLDWKDVGVGAYLVVARASDDDGATASSNPIRVVVLPVLPPVVSISATQPEVLESDTAHPGVFTVSRTGSTADPLAVSYRIRGTAANELDYAKLSGSVTIPAGERSATIQVVPVPDSVKELRESVILQLTKATASDTKPASTAVQGYVLGFPRNATVTIFDERPVGASLVIDSPEDGTTIEAKSDLKIEATAIDPRGYIGRVDFLANGRVIGTSRVLFIRAPEPGTPIHHSFVWRNVRAGSYQVTAQARATSGAALVSPAVTVTATAAEKGNGKSPNLASKRRLILKAEAGHRYSIQSSSDLVSWMDLGELESTDGTIDCTDEDPDSGRFYRAVPLE